MCFFFKKILICWLSFTLIHFAVATEPGEGEGGAREQHRGPAQILRAEDTRARSGARPAARHVAHAPAAAAGPLAGYNHFWKFIQLFY